MSTILRMDVTTVPITRVTPYPGNARQGDQTAIAASLTEHGQYRPLVVQRSTGHVLCGNNTLAAAHHLDWTEVAVQYVDVDDDRARKILLADNKTNDGATYDEHLLAQLLADVDDLDGTGYDTDEVDDLLAALEEEPPPAPDPEPEPGPDPDGDAPTPPAGGSPPAPPGDLPPPPGADSGPLQHGERLDDNTTWVRSINDKKDTYQSSHTRQIILAYQGETYIRVVDALAALAEEYGTTNNADTVRVALDHLTTEQEHR